MLSSKEKDLLLYIIKHCQRIESKIIGVSLDAFISNDDIKEIVCFNVLQIGELAKGFSPDFLKLYSKMPWKNIKGMGDYVAHGYGTINLKEIYRTATEDIVPLRQYCEEIIHNG